MWGREQPLPPLVKLLYYFTSIFVKVNIFDIHSMPYWFWFLDFSNYKLQIQQVIRRLFPFGRGLCHAYWAPNFWVFYIMSDKGIAFIFRKLGFHIQTPAASFTAGLVGDSSPFSVLPQVRVTFRFFCFLNKFVCRLTEKITHGVLSPMLTVHILA